MTQRVTDLAWYENPTWERHVMVKDMTSMVNLAAADIDGDGIPEVAIQNEFSMVAAKSPGLVWLLRHQGDPRGPGRRRKIDQLITSHHIAWADVDGDGKKELINAPLIGPKGPGAALRSGQRVAGLLPRAQRSAGRVEAAVDRRPDERQCCTARASSSGWMASATRS